ncbi:hypothetical protein CSV79_01675 [Sporosarcina sp. P13]|uniref:hypothetical protein n=1 Tax=Sporosarcina sp. P13 TaxID=2048263 RepID=UPI000C16F896|nr:hypothetical protein [Sporosarcina sp. P13]PIC65357.1 hypothetical protein CSV79_01675 [Sporosarcina sp. P13]
MINTNDTRRIIGELINLHKRWTHPFTRNKKSVERQFGNLMNELSYQANTTPEGALELFKEALKESDKERQPTTFLLSSANIKWEWKEWELKRFRKLWNKGWHIDEMAEKMRTNQQSIALLVMDQEFKGKIEPRKFGLYGN